MLEEVHVVNTTMELSECANKWTFDEKQRCWCLEDVLYTPKATVPKYQRMSIFVPEVYMKKGGVINREGETNGYHADTVPVIFENNSAGYMQMTHVRLGGSRCYADQYLEAGCIYVSCGNRGHESVDQDGKYCGKSPINLVDLKTGIRFLRHNAKNLPGDYTKIISVGCSAGGAMSTLLSVTGDNENYRELLEKNGAFMEESDAVYGAQIYCPITDLEHADLAYEWMFTADKENEASPVGPAGIMTPFQEALSQKLKKRYISYFNSLGLTNPSDGTPIRLNEDGRSGSAYDYLMGKIEEAANIFLRKLETGELSETYSPRDYLTGNYTIETLVQPPERMSSRGPVPPMKSVKGKDKSSWLSWDGEKASIRDLDSYVLNHRRRMKPCTSFDILSMESSENKVFGSDTVNSMHFSAEVADAILELREEFPKEYETYYEAYAKAKGDPDLEKRRYLINPLNFIGTNEKSRQPMYYRIRVGACDADTSFSVSMTLALKLLNAGKNVDYQLVWDKPHCEADYAGEVIQWIQAIVQ